jgi:NAD(P)-dependent dehydrogenase (short-subunit alcohol dehydrogenase family)
MAAGIDIVTGGSSGLGAAVVTALAARGRHLVVLDLRPPQDGDPPFVAVDLADARRAEAAVADVVERSGDPSAVVTCAGIDACGPFDSIDTADWEQVVAVNLIGTVAVIRAALAGASR